LASTSDEQIIAAVRRLAALDDPRAIGALEALGDDRLRAGADGRAWVWNQKTRELVDPFTGATAPGSARPAREVESNNDIRREVGPALASLQLASPTAAVRLAAAEELANGGGGEAAELLRKALGREQDGKVKNALGLAVARLDLHSPDAATRLVAVQQITRSGNDQFLGELQRLTAKNPDGTFADPDERVRGEADKALSAILGRRRTITAVASLLHGLSLASVLLFAALGLAITFGLLASSTWRTARS
jgi:urea transport system permease protein